LEMYLQGTVPEQEEDLENLADEDLEQILS
jgi:hypothetical protein